MQNTFNVLVDLKVVKSVPQPLVTQNDSVVFILEVMENGVPFDLNDTTTVTLAHTRKDQSVVVTQGTKAGNKATFALGTNETSITGAVAAKAQFYDANGRVSSLSFTYQVGVDPTGRGYIPSVSEATLIEVVLNDGPLIIQSAEEAAAYANEQGDYALEVAAKNETRFLNAVSTVALRDSTYPTPSHGDTVRVTGTSTSYRYVLGTGWVVTDVYNSTAIDEVNQQLADKAKYNGQADFTEMVKGLTEFDRVRFRKLATDLYEVAADNGTKHSTYRFRKDPTDDFIKAGKASVGLVSGGDLLVSETYATNLVGTWSTASPPHYYTTQIGATHDGVATGDKIIFRHRKNTQGGIWEFVIDGNTANPITVSTWAAVDTSGVSVDTVLKTGLTNTTHTIVGTFKGADPLHPATLADGVTPTTARGWIWSKPTDPLHTTFKGYLAGANMSYTDLLVDHSNKEIVFNIGYAGVNTWIPEHDGIPVTFNKVVPKFLMDDVTIDINSIPLNQWVEGKKFKLIQNNYIRTPESGATNLLEWNITHAIGTDGVLNYNGFAKALAVLRINLHYPLMLPVEYPQVNEVITSIGNSKVSANDGIDYYFPEETDETLSVCFVSSAKPNLIVAGTIVYPYKTMRIGKPEKPPATLRFWQRADQPKIYFQPTENWDLAIGDSYAWAGKIVVGDIQNIYQYVKG